MQRSASLPQSRPASAPWAGWRLALEQTRQRLADPADRAEILWRALWRPYWAWADAPPAEMPHREPATRVDPGRAGQAVIDGLDRARRRLWLTHALAAICRAVWLGLLVAAALMLADLAGGPAFAPRLALVLGGILLVGGIILAAVSQPSRARTARMLDRSFGLHERMTTALGDLGLGVPNAGERPPVVYLQMADAANAIAVLRGNSRLRPALPTREITLIALVGLILATLAFLRGLGGGLPALGAPNVPPFAPAIARPAPPTPSAADIAAAASPQTTQEVLERADRSAQARHDLQTLASALEDQAATRQAAESITRGDYSVARDQLRSVAEQTGDLSPDARSALANDLADAATAMTPQTSGLHEATSQAASGLQGSDAAARQGMRDLGDAVEQAGRDVVPPDQLSSQMQGAQQAQGPNAQGESRAAAPSGGELNNASTRFNATGDPGQGATANATSSEDRQNRSSGQEQPSGAQPGDEAAGQQQGSGQPGRANSPGQGGEEGSAENGARGGASRAGTLQNSGTGDTESARARQGAGAGAGHDSEQGGQQSSSASGASDRETGGGVGPAAPNVTTGGSAESEPRALPAIQDQMALPASDGQEGVQTVADGGSALRGSGAGVTAGSGYAQQSEVGEAGPDSNRVPPEHRETVERYFSNGGG
jgi:hypothetical protein